MFKSKDRLIKIVAVCCLLFTQAAYPWQEQNLWDELRQDFQLSKHQNSEAVQAEIDWFRTHRKIFNRMAEDAIPYLYYVHNEVRRLGMPGEVALIPMVESAYNPFSYSKAGAAGLWQIMPGTGSGLGLQINWWYDGRRDVVASTQAALNYFKKLNRIFRSDWLLTIAAYDSGEGTVQHAMQQNADLNKNLDFWSLPLPNETQKYIPKLLALVEIIKNPDLYDLNLPYIPNRPYFSNVQVGKQMDLGVAAQMAQIKLTDLYKLNPGYNRWSTTPDGPQSLLLPVENAKLLQQGLSHHAYTEHKTSVKQIHIHKGETLQSIAMLYNTSPAELKKINHLHSNYVRAGTKISVPAEAETSLLESRKKVLLAYQTENTGPHRAMHMVAANESLESIARTYQVKVSAIRFWNHLRATQNPQPGDVLTVWTTLPASQIRLAGAFKAHH